MWFASLKEQMSDLIVTVMRNLPRSAVASMLLVQLCIEITLKWRNNLNEERPRKCGAFNRQPETVRIIRISCATANRRFP